MSDSLPTYNKSKILSETAAWKFREELPEEERFDLVAINPSFVIGPTLMKQPFSSAEMIKSFMDGSMSKLPYMRFPAVDVRDVARAHVNALTTDHPN